MALFSPELQSFSIFDFNTLFLISETEKEWENFDLFSGN